MRRTRLLLGLAGALMGAAGVVATFLPQEVLAIHRAPPDRGGTIALRFAGALYLGFGVMNWLSRGIRIGGIYARPLALANFIYFTVMAFTLAPIAGAAVTPPPLLGAALHAAFAVWFGRLVFGPSPAPEGSAGR